MTKQHAVPLTLAREASRGNAAWVTLSNKVLGNARKRNALRNEILAGASPENRTLFAYHFAGNENAGRAWRLLIAIAGA